MYQNQVTLSRERRRFGRQVMFEDRNELMVSVHPSSRLRLKYILGNPQNQSSQLSKQLAFSEVETDNATFEDRGMFHYEGGWPKEVNMNDEEQTLRHRKKVERDDNWGTEVKELIRFTNTVAAQNNAINIYNHFFDDLPADMGRTICMPFKSRTINIIHDLWLPPRHMSIINWMPNDNSILTQYTNLYTQRNEDVRLTPKGDSMGSSNAFYLWDITNPIKPLYYYDSIEVIKVAAICPKEESNLAGGTLTGKVCTWDVFENGMLTSICPMEAAHREQCSAITWVHSKSNTEFYTASLDGSVKFWDTRDLKVPTNEIYLEPNPMYLQNRQDAHGCTVLEFEYTIPVRFIAGSDLGHVFVGNRKGINPVEMLPGNFPICCGPIRTIHRNPFFVKNFLIVGDWRARIWCEEVKNRPSTMYVKKRTQLMCGAWSTGRASLFVTGDMDGVLDFWDFLLDQRKPIYSLNFQSTITAVVFKPGGEFLSISLANGDTHIMNLDDAMKRTTSKEKALMAAMFEREISRSKLLEDRVDEIKLRRRTALLEEEETRKSREASKVDELTMTLPVPDLELDPDNPDQFIKMIESDEQFRLALANFHDTLEAIDRKRAAEKKVMERTDFEQLYLDNLAEQQRLEKKRAGSITSRDGLRKDKKKGAAAKAAAAAAVKPAKK